MEGNESLSVLNLSKQKQIILNGEHKGPMLEDNPLIGKALDADTRCATCMMILVGLSCMIPIIFPMICAHSNGC